MHVTLHMCCPDDREITPIHFTRFPWQLNNVLERNRQMLSIVGSIPRDVSVFPAANEEHYTDPPGQSSYHTSRSYGTYCIAAAEGQLMYVSSPRRRHMRATFPPRLSNVLLIYTCWAQGCIGICSTLTASITQQALLLPFKIHLKRLAGATVHPGMDVTILMCYCEECWLETAGNLCAHFFFFFFR